MDPQEKYPLLQEARAILEHKKGFWTSGKVKATWISILTVGIILIVALTTQNTGGKEDEEIRQQLTKSHWSFWKRRHTHTNSTTRPPPIDDVKNNGSLFPPEDPATTRFREYLRLKTVQPDPDYNSAIQWIKNQANSIGLEFQKLEFDPPNLFVVWLTWRGLNQSLPSILLNSHMDVVPADMVTLEGLHCISSNERWTHDPFAAEKDEVTGNIYGRGAQDMKSVGVQYLEAVRSLKSQGVTPIRNVHILFVPDEENGGNRGMSPFVKSKEFQDLNVGFALDEGMSSPTDQIFVVWAERAIWQVEFTAQGQSGHASILHENTAAEKIQKIINLMLDLRTREKDRLIKEKLEPGDVTSINLTMMKGGQQPNVVPSELSVTFDIRITPSWELNSVQNILDNFVTQAGPGVSYSFIQKSDIIAQTPLVDDNVWWRTLQSAATESGIVLHPTIHPGATDIRYVRQLGIPAFGFTPIVNTTQRAHDHDEYLNEGVFLNGIKLYEQILPTFFNLI